MTGLYGRPPAGPLSSGRTSTLASQTRISRLYRVGAAVELAKIGQAADRQPVGVLFASRGERINIFRHPGAGLRARRGGTFLQEFIGLHDAIDGGFHGILGLMSILGHAIRQARLPRTWRSPCWRAGSC